MSHRAWHGVTSSRVDQVSPTNTRNVTWSPKAPVVAAYPTVAAGVGLGGTQLANAAAGSGVGTADLDALLELVFPTNAGPGTYQATLTLTTI